MTSSDRTEFDRIQVYKSQALFRRGWRWRYIAKGNNARMANGGEAYTRYGQALEGAARVCGITQSVSGGWTEVAPGPTASESWLVRRGVDRILIEVLA